MTGYDWNCVYMSSDFTFMIKTAVLNARTITSVVACGARTTIYM